MTRSSTRRAATLPVAFFERSAAEVARALLGKVVVSTIGGEETSGRIVETEAYLGRDDPASHAFGGRRNAQNQSIYGPTGSWYVYRSYGMHWCANLVCAGPAGGSAVLLRALEPVAGLDVMGRRRGSMAPRLYCAGPGRLCQALGIDRRLDGVMMPPSEVVVLDASDPDPGEVQTTPRIGITRAADWPLRFILADSPALSRRR